ncbi:hypothetical protein CRE_17738 [Caenorhabditis remanei]|uniref:Galectin n=1 Tax=Caenorhabditis remanei TaxID=31234 RepID=E3NQF1_CAERE|nr:hypothetical protein CRE_17738 [Caenorhabditis remanei]
MDDLIHAYSLISKGISMDTPKVEENVDNSTETNSSKLEHVGSNSAQFPIVEHGHNFVYSTSLELRVGAEIAIDAIIQSRFLIVIYNHNRRLFRFDTYIHSNGTGNREEIHFLMSIREEFGSIVFNSFFRRTWDTEERRIYPALPNNFISIRIQVLQAGFQVISSLETHTYTQVHFQCSINNSWFKFFEHRLPLSSIEAITIRGSHLVRVHLDTEDYTEGEEMVEDEEHTEGEEMAEDEEYTEGEEMAEDEEYTEGEEMTADEDFTEEE